MIDLKLQIFGGRGSGGGRGRSGKTGGGGMTKAEEDKRVAELDKSGHFRYHATTESAISGIKEKGLQPSRGMYGNGVYFAESSDAAQGWAESSTGGKVILRVDNRTLVKAGYGEFKGDQGWTDTGIASSNIQIRTSKGSWIPIKDAVISYNKGTPSIIKRPKR